MIALFALLPFIGKRSGDIVFLIIAFLVGGGFSILVFYGMLSVLKWRIEIYSDKLREINLFKINEIRIDAIKGVELLPTQYLNLIRFIPKDPKAKKQKIDLIMCRTSWPGWMLLLPI